MKLHVFSDVHAGFGAFEPPEVDADVLVLPGDIDVGLDGVKLAKAWSRGRPVLYVAGNHEFYGESIPRHIQKLRDAAAGSDVRFLENDEVVLGGVRFLGCTLWTDFDLLGDRGHAMASAQAAMNDYRQIRVDPTCSRLRPIDTISLHARSIRWLVETLETPLRGPP